jgi:hypothetical protein
MAYQDYHFKSPRIVQGSRGRVIFLWVLLALCAVAVAAWLGLLDGDPDLRECERQVAQLREENSTLGEQVAHLQRSSELNNQLSRKTMSDMEQLLQERGELEKEVALLESLVGDEVVGGLELKDIDLTAQEQANAYRLRFRIANMTETKGYVNGRIEVSLAGTLQGQARTLDHGALTGAGKPQKMRFKNFQDVEVSLELPEDFQPDRLLIDVIPGNKGLQPIKMERDWLVRQE